MPITASQIAEQLQGEVVGDGTVELLGFAAADKAREGDLTFAEREIYFTSAEQSKARLFSCLDRLPPSARSSSECRIRGWPWPGYCRFFPAR
jgi:UDP-3-O-[3-hydroxymyristoyl] glucosamine N-acyltransferase